MRVFPVFSSVRAFTLSGVFLHRSLSTGFRSLGKRVCLPQLRYPRLPVLPARLPQPTPLPQLCPFPTSVVSETLGMQRCLEPSLRLGELPLRVLFSCPSPRIKELLGNSISGWLRFEPVNSHVSLWVACVSSEDKWWLWGSHPVSLCSTYTLRCLLPGNWLCKSIVITEPTLGLFRQEAVIHNFSQVPFNFHIYR